MSDQTCTSRPIELDPVDQCPPGGRLFTLALQHVLVMYAGAVAVPLIVGRAAQVIGGSGHILDAALPPDFRKATARG